MPNEIDEGNAADADTEIKTGNREEVLEDPPSVTVESKNKDKGNKKIRSPKIQNTFIPVQIQRYTDEDEYSKQKNTPFDSSCLIMYHNENANKKIYYNGHEYTWLWRMYICFKSGNCKAGLVLLLNETSVLEFGIHTCNKSEANFDSLSLVTDTNNDIDNKEYISISNVNDNITAGTSNEKTVRSTNICLESSERENKRIKFKSNYKSCQKSFSQDINPIFRFYKVKKGKEERCIYYNGHTYSPNRSHMKNTLICSKSIKCQAGLKINPEKNGAYEMGLHICGKRKENFKRAKRDIYNKECTIISNVNDNRTAGTSKKKTVRSNHVMKFSKIIKGKEQKCLYYKGYSYSYNRSRIKNIALCSKSIKCQAGLKINQKKNCVYEIGIHICGSKIKNNSVRGESTSEYTMTTVGNKNHDYIITEESNDNKTLDLTNLSLEGSDSKYVRVKFKFDNKTCQKYFIPDINIVTEFYKQIGGRKQKCLYYKGYSYTHIPFSRNTFVCASPKSNNCQAELKINQEKNGVCEMGLHKCSKRKQNSKKYEGMSGTTSVTSQSEDIVDSVKMEPDMMNTIDEIKLESYNYMELYTDNQFEHESDSNKVTVEYPAMENAEFECCLNGNNLLEQESGMEISKNCKQTARISSVLLKDAPVDITNTNHISFSQKNVNGNTILDLETATDISDKTNLLIPYFLPTINEPQTPLEMEHNNHLTALKNIHSVPTLNIVKIEPSSSFDNDIEQKSQENLLLDNAMQDLVGFEPDNLKIYEADKVQIEANNLNDVTEPLGDAQVQLACFEGVLGAIYSCKKYVVKQNMIDLDTPNIKSKKYMDRQNAIPKINMYKQNTTVDTRIDTPNVKLKKNRCKQNTMIDRDTANLGPSKSSEIKTWVPSSSSKKLTDGHKYVQIKKVINLLCNYFQTVHLEEQTLYEIVNAPTDETWQGNGPIVKFKGHLHQNKSVAVKNIGTTYHCLKFRVTKCTGMITFKDYKVLRYREHFCLGRDDKRFLDLDLSKEYHSIILYFNGENNCTELLYQNYTYWKIIEASDCSGGFTWKCTKSDCEGQLKVESTVVCVLHDHNCNLTASTNLQTDEIHRVVTDVQNEEIPSKSIDVNSDVKLPLHEDGTNAQCKPQEEIKNICTGSNLCGKITTNKEEINYIFNEKQIKKEKLPHDPEGGSDSINFAENECTNDKNLEEASKAAIKKILVFKKECEDLVDDSIEINLKNEDH